MCVCAKIGFGYSIWVSIKRIDRIVIKNKMNSNVKTRRACVRGAHDKTSHTVHPSYFRANICIIRVPRQCNTHLVNLECVLS